MAWRAGGWHQAFSTRSQERGLVPLKPVWVWGGIGGQVQDLLVPGDTQRGHSWLPGCRTGSKVVMLALTVGVCGLTQVPSPSLTGPVDAGKLQPAAGSHPWGDRTLGMPSPQRALRTPGSSPSSAANVRATPRGALPSLGLTGSSLVDWGGFS